MDQTPNNQREIVEEKSEKQRKIFYSNQKHQINNVDQDFYLTKSSMPTKKSKNVEPLFIPSVDVENKKVIIYRTIFL